MSTLGEEGNQLESAGLKGAGAQGKLGCRKCACEKGCALKGARAPTSGKQLWSGKSHWTTNLPGLAAVPALLFAFLGWLALAENFLPSPLFQPSAGLALGGATFLSGLALPTLPLLEAVGTAPFEFGRYEKCESDLVGRVGGSKALWVSIRTHHAQGRLGSRLGNGEKIVSCSKSGSTKQRRKERKGVQPEGSQGMSSERFGGMGNATAGVPGNRFQVQNSVSVGQPETRDQSMK